MKTNKRRQYTRLLTLDDVAELTGVSKPMLGQIKRGQSSPTINILWKMEDVLDVYEKTYNSAVPVVCMDEKPYQLLGEASDLLPMCPVTHRKPIPNMSKMVAAAFLYLQNHWEGVRYVSVREHRIAVDWAEEIKYLTYVCYPEQETIILVMDNLNTHALSSLYKAFPASEARGIARKLKIYFTLKYGSWLNIAEIEFNVMTRQCLSQRINDIGLLC